MQEEVEWPLLAACLAGEATAEQERQLMQWVRRDPRHQALYAQMQALLQVHQTRPKPARQFNEERAFQQLTQRIEIFAPETANLPLRVNRTETPLAGETPPVARRVLWAASTARWAAAILLVCTAALGLYAWWSTRQASPALTAMRELVVPRGRKLSITLADGTQVQLNSGSRLRYPQSFQGTTREVTLQGEAFFIVTPNPQRPFLIRTRTTAVRVLGTSFSVRAYPTDDVAETVVMTGQVAVRALDRPDSVLLLPNQKVTYSAARHEFTSSTVEPASIAPWKQGHLVFDNASLAEVVQRLENWYNVDIDTDLARLPACRLTATFQGESLEQVLKYIGLVMPLEYRIQGQQVHFEVQTCAPKSLPKP